VYNIYMLNWFKKHFIPHEGNEHRPHFLRKENIKNVAIFIIFVEAFVFLLPTLTHLNRTGGMAAVLPAVLSSLTNEERQSQNLSSLTVNSLLQKAAEMKANDMATKGYFAHTSPEGKTPWYWIDLSGYKYQYAGENLAINFNDSKDVTNAWMNSPTHRANIVKDKYTEVGTGIATGIYQGRQTIFVAQVYANPISIKEEVKKVINVDKVTNLSVKKVTTGTDILKQEIPKVLGAEVEETLVEKNTTTKEISFWQKIITSPRNSTDMILYVVGLIVFIVLILNIFIKIKHHHPNLIINGLVVIAIISTIISINYYFSYKDMVITQSIDYSSENK